MMRSPRIAVVVISMNDSHWLGPCLQSLSAACGEPVSVVVVVNDCSDSTLEVCASAPLPLTLLHTEYRAGYSVANNLGLRWALDKGFEYAMLLNPDTVIRPDSISTLARFLDKKPEYGIAGSLQFEYADHSWSSWNEWSRVTVEHARSLGSVLESNTYHWMDHYYVQGAAMMLRLGVVPRVGLLDPLYGSFYEETDLCRRHLLLGLKVAIVFDSKVRHFGGGNWRSTQERRWERDHSFLRNQYFYYLSGERTPIGFLKRLVHLFARHYRAVRHGREDVTLPWWRYFGVVADASRNARFFLQLIARNRLISAGRPLPGYLWSIGRP